MREQEVDERDQQAASRFLGIIPLFAKVINFSSRADLSEENARIARSLNSTEKQNNAGYVITA